jgi:uncharacterized protein (PEP-CTERM system associated)
LPEADLNARLEAIERWLFLEAAVKTSQASSDPFGVRPEPGTTTNTLTTRQTRFSPSIEAPIDALTRYRVRSDNTWVHLKSAESTSTPDPAAAGYFGQHKVSIEHDPRPFGWRLDAERDETRYRVGVTAPLVNDSVRLAVDYALSPELAAGLRGGYERNSLVAGDRQGKVYGAQARWQPSPRTLLSAEGERRYFGSAWKLGFDHRTPRLAFSLSTSRSLQTTPQSLFELPATGDVTALLDEIFKARIPDRDERARAVQIFKAAQGLPDATLGPSIISAQRQSLVTTRGGSVGWVSARDSLVLSGFNTRTEDLPDATLLATGAPIANNRQYGVGLTFSRRLSALASVSCTLDWSRIRALGPTATALTTQLGTRVQLSLQAAPRTGVVFGGRYRKLDSNIAFPGREVTLFTGLDHRF